MGFFSWNTQDTNKSICNTFSGQKTFPVYMHDNKGNVWKEDDYEGYGIFGEKDYYELLAEMNGFPSDRSIGIDITYGDILKNPIFPQLFENKSRKPKTFTQLKTCVFQGFFYPERDYENC